MKRNGTETRARILDVAEQLMLDSGYGGTTVRAVVDRAGVTKGAFFHHFESKLDLAHALIERSARRDAREMEELLDRAERLARDPLQQILMVVALVVEEMETLDGPHPGCLFASYTYQEELLDEDARAVVHRVMTRWRERLSNKFREAIDRHPPRMDVDPEGLADMFLVVYEGACVLSRMMGEASLPARQYAHYRSYLELVFDVEE